MKVGKKEIQKSILFAFITKSCWKHLVFTITLSVREFRSFQKPKKLPVLFFIFNKLQKTLFKLNLFQNKKLELFNDVSRSFT